MSNVCTLAFTITRATTPERRALLARTIRDGRSTAGCDFTWVVHDYSMDPSTVGLLVDLISECDIKVYNDVNRGQHVAFNTALASARVNGYDYLLRIDDDIEWLTKRWLVRMLEASTALGPSFILSPTVRGLQHPPPMSQLITHAGIPLRVLTDAIGGACRLHPTRTLTDAPTPYVSDVRKPLGMGDATGIVAWGVEMTAAKWPVVFAWLDHVRVRHATTAQEAADPVYHAQHAVMQKVPYIPSWSAA